MLPLSFNHQVCKVLCPLSTEIIPWPRDKLFKQWQCFILSNKALFQEMNWCNVSVRKYSHSILFGCGLYENDPKMSDVSLSDTNAFHLCCLSESSPTELLCSGHTQPFTEGKTSSLIFCSEICLNCIL